MTTKKELTLTYKVQSLSSNGEDVVVVNFVGEDQGMFSVSLPAADAKAFFPNEKYVLTLKAE